MLRKLSFQNYVTATIQRRATNTATTSDEQRPYSDTTATATVLQPTHTGHQSSSDAAMAMPGTSARGKVPRFNICRHKLRERALEAWCRNCQTGGGPCSYRNLSKAAWEDHVLDLDSIDGPPAPQQRLAHRQRNEDYLRTHLHQKVKRGAALQGAIY